jgi:hypothetical protein
MTATIEPRPVTEAEIEAWAGSNNFWAWKHEYRELNEDRLGWCFLWQPFVQDKLAAYFGVSEGRTDG